MQNTINETLVRIAHTYGYEYVATNNTFYVFPDDAEVQDMVTCVALSRELDDPDRPTLMNGDYSVRPSREMEELFVQYPRAYENTTKIAHMIDLQIEYGAYKIPKFPLSKDENEKYEKYLVDISTHNSDTSNQSFQLLTTEEWLLRSLCIE